MSDDFDIENAIRSAGHPPSPQSRDQIRGSLEAAIRGESVASVHQIGDSPRNGHRRLMFTLAGLTAAAAAALGALVVVNREETVLEETPATDPPVESTVPVPPTSLSPSTVAPDTVAPGTTTPGTRQPATTTPMTVTPTTPLLVPATTPAPSTSSPAPATTDVPTSQLPTTVAPTTAVPTTTTAAPTTTPVPADDRPVTLSIEDASVFGFAPARASNPDDPVATIARTLGSPDHDSGWEPQDDGCYTGGATRVLWWGDLKIEVARGAPEDPGELIAWSAGEPTGSVTADPYEPPAEATTPVRPVEDGVGIGTAERDLLERFGDRLSSGGDLGGGTTGYGPDPIEAWPQVLRDEAPSATLSITVEDGVVTGISAGFNAC